jgi:hypothetical protein
MVELPKEIEKCRVYICRDKKTGKVTLRPDGCSKNEFVEYVKEIRKNKGFAVDLDDVT